MRVGTHGMMQVDYEQRIDFDRMRKHRVDRIKKYMGLIEKTSGLILVAMGVLIFTNSLTLLQTYLPFLNRFAL